MAGLSHRGIAVTRATLRLKLSHRIAIAEAIIWTRGMEEATLFRRELPEWPLTSQPRRRPGAASREHPGRRLVEVAYGSRRQARAPRWDGPSDPDVEYRIAFPFAKRS